MNEEMKKVIDKAMIEEFNRGYLQGVWDFLQELKTTHKLPQEIANELMHEQKGSIQA